MTWLYRSLLAISALLLFLATACTAPVNAPAGAKIGEMDEVDIVWDPSWEGFPEYWALVRAQYFVYDEQSQVPLNNISIEVFSGYDKVYLLPTGVINVANCPQGEGQWDSYCSDPNQTWGELTGDFNDSLQPTYFQGATDGSGVETVWIWIEDMPVSSDGSQLQSVPISATIGIHTMTFKISPMS